MANYLIIVVSKVEVQCENINDSILSTDLMGFCLHSFGPHGLTK